MSYCCFIHSAKSGGRVGEVCGRPEAEHCPHGYGCTRIHPKPGAVHHPFHRRALERGCTKHGAVRKGCRSCARILAQRKTADAQWRSAED